MPDRPERGTNMTRRRLLAAGGGAVGLAVAGGGYALGARQDDAAAGSAASVPFYGAQQAGITTPPQDRLMFAAFDLALARAGELRDLLRTWTAAAALMTAGRPAGSPGGDPDAPPADTGEAVGLGPARLTVTFGFGPRVFRVNGEDRFGLAAREPAALAPLGPLPGDQLEPERSNGDLCIQACADDPQVAFHAIRDLARVARGAAVMRWTQVGFGRAASTGRDQLTPRNLQGFKDGTNNIRSDDRAALTRFVWAGSEEPQRWFRGGTYMVTRRIRMLIETWDRSPLLDQEQTIGRLKITGAPIGGVHEMDHVNLQATTADGQPEIAVDAHIRLAAPASNGGEKILRRGYSYVDGVDATTGELDAGLFFIAFQRDPHHQFAAIQRRLGGSDKLNEYIKHTGSALFAIPPGVRRGGSVGDGLFSRS
jgi:deferrochelatase/peroxidase EfeB